MIQTLLSFTPGESYPTGPLGASGLMDPRCLLKGRGARENSMLRTPRQTGSFCVSPAGWKIRNRVCSPSDTPTPWELHRGTRESYSVSLGAGVQTWDPRLGEGQTLTCWFRKNWQCVRNTTSSFVKWEKIIGLTASPALASSSSTCVSSPPSLTDPQESSRSQKK